MDALEHKIKELIIEALDLEDVRPEDIESDAPLFDEQSGLGLDSIDALELGIALQKAFQIKVDAEDEETRRRFSSVRELARFVEQSRQQVIG